MATIYFYVDSSKLDKILSFGLKLSDNFSHTVPINGLEKRVFVGLLNPKDELTKYNSNEYTCLKINLYPEQCYVLNEVSLIITPKDGNYNLIPLNEYNYGFYENPRVIFNTSILPEQISVLDETMDEPILYESSKDLYYQIRVQRIIDELPPEDVYFALCEYFDCTNKQKSNLEQQKTNDK
jgi:hypothetical protein